MGRGERRRGKRPVRGVLRIDTQIWASRQRNEESSSAELGIKRNALHTTVCGICDTLAATEEQRGHRGEKGEASGLCSARV